MLQSAKGVKKGKGGPQEGILAFHKARVGLREPKTNNKGKGHHGASKKVRVEGRGVVLKSVDGFWSSWALKDADPL